MKDNLGITVEALSALLILPYQEVLTAVTVMEADGILTTDLLGRRENDPGRCRLDGAPPDVGNRPQASRSAIPDAGPVSRVCDGG